MHDGCSGAGHDGATMLQKVRMMGFSGMPLPVAIPIACGECGESFSMTHFETACGHCGIIHAVTPCSASDPMRILSTGTKE